MLAAFHPSTYLRNVPVDPPPLEVTREPKSRRSLRTLVLSLAGAILSIAYLMNPSAGFIEGIPDNIPLIGNLDEATATIVLLYCLSNLGINLLPGARQGLRKTLRSADQ